MTIIDAYSHVGLPRFQSIDDYLLTMADSRIDRAVLSAFGSCPDLPALHRALSARPEVFRLIGIPIGADRQQTEATARAQFVAGFSALRLADEDVLEKPWLLDVISEADAVAFVCGGSVSTDRGARILLRHLGDADVQVVGGHFAGPRDPSVLASGAVAELFAHPRFSVVCSRHGAFAAELVEPWAVALVEAVGWGRLMWGAETPVLYWRDETLSSALAWVDRLAPSASERAAFLGDNAERVFFNRPARPGQLALGLDPWEFAPAFPAQLWLNSLHVDQRLAGRLVHGWIAAGGARVGPLGSYVAGILDQAIPLLPEGRPPG